MKAHITVLLISLALLGNALAKVYYVDHRVDNSGGNSWAKAFSHPQTALDKAVAGDEIWIAQGTYTPNEQTDDTDSRTATFQLKTGVALYGGFSGTETSRSQRNPGENVTILSGDIGTSNDASDNAYHVLTCSGTTSTALISGFSIIHGNANRDSLPHNSGGGVYCESGSATIAHCVFSDNSANWRAGAIFNRSSSSPLLVNCLFSGNSVTYGYGGAIYNLSSTPSLINCTIAGNSSNNPGGGIYNSSSSPNLTNCIIWGNESGGSTSSSSASVSDDLNSSTTYNYSLIQNLDLTSVGTGNLDGTSSANDPAFLSPVAPSLAPTLEGKYQLTLTSKAIDTADHDTYKAAYNSTVDVAGNSRTADAPTSDTGTGATYTYLDMGAFEVVNFERPLVTALSLTRDTASSMVFDVSFDQEVVGLEGASDLSIGTTGTLAYTEVSISGSEKNYTITLAGLSGNGEVSLSILTDGSVTSLYGAPVDDHLGLQGAVHLTARSTIHYVNAESSTPVGPYSSWNTAAATIQDALVYAVDGDEVYVAKGSYRPTSLDDRSASFELRNGIAIYGGFAGTELSLEDRDISLNPTILTGDIGIIDDSSDNLYHVVNSDGTDSSAVLDGFTISDGLANKAGSTNGGAGLYSNDGSPTLRNCNFTNNQATIGGALYSLAGSPHLSDCHFSGNVSTTSGGAIYFEASTGGHTTSTVPQPVLQDCSFTNNSSDLGGAVYLYRESLAHFQNCAFSGNSARKGGAIYEDNTTLDLGGDGNNVSNFLGTTYDSCVFSSNLAQTGGAIYEKYSLPHFNKCEFTSNEATAYSGGAISSSNVLIITDCKFEMNSAIQSGGAIHSGAPVLLINDSNFSQNSSTLEGGAIYQSNGYTADYFSIENCSFLGNSASDNGGAVSHNTSFGSYTNCQFKGNASTHHGGAIHSESSSQINFTNTLISGNASDLEGGGIANTGRSHTTFTNCTIVANSSLSYGDGVYNEWIFNDRTGTESVSTATANNCIFWDNSTLSVGDFPKTNCIIEYGAAHTISDDPLFVSPLTASDAPTELGDYRLLAGSPALGTGADTHYAEIPIKIYDFDTDQRVDTTFAGADFDLAGTPRHNDTIDIGCYEGGYTSFATAYNGLTESGDENENGKSNFLDYALGANPSELPNPPLENSISGSELTFHKRAHTVDFDVLYQMSTDLNHWTTISEGVDYNLKSKTSASGITTTIITLPAPDNALPAVFFRQKFISP